MARFKLDPEDLAITYSYREFLGFLWQRVRPYRRKFILASIFRATSDLAWLYPAYALASIVTLLSHIDQNTTRAVTTIAIWWSLATVWRLIGQFGTKYFGFQVSERAGMDTRLMATLRLFQLDMSWHERENSGNKLKRIDRGATAVNQTIRLWFRSFIEIVINLTGMLFIITRITPGMGLSMMVFIIVFLLLSAFLTKKASVMETIVNRKEEELQGLAFEAVNNIRTVKALDMRDTLDQRLTHETADLFSRVKERIWRFQGRSSLLSTWGHAFRIVSVLYIIYGIIHGQYSLGFLILFQSYFNRLWESVAEVSELAPDLVAAKFAVGRLDQIVHEPVRIDETAGKQPFPRDWETIEVKNLSFAYGRTQVLSDVSFTIQRGERIGIVGLSGAGKSTLFKLLMKEHEGYQGSITFDGLSLRDIEKRSYLRALASVLQDTEVFNFTLQENINIAYPEGSDQQLHQALDVAHVSDFLIKLPKGLQTLIGEKGFRLSGGEKQRVGLARAIYKQPQILLLDEATSHLDLESEKKIQESLHQFFQKVTAIVIAHRLTTIKEMDRILVIEGGQIIESGSFQVLRGQHGRFYELWEQQRL